MARAGPLVVGDEHWKRARWPTAGCWALAAAAFAAAGCARLSAHANGPMLVPPVRVYSASGLVLTAVAASPSFAVVQDPGQAELRVEAREESVYGRRWAFPGLLVNLLTLPVGYFTFAYRCSAETTVEVIADEGKASGPLRFTKLATAARTFFQYQPRPEQGEAILSPGYEVVRTLARRELARRLALRLAQEWARNHPERVAPASAEARGMRGS